jgi:hypothetical protein
MAATYEPIATTTVSGSSTSSVSFTSLSSAYTDIVAVIQASTAGDANFYLRVNSDTGTNYSTTNVYGDGSSALSTRQSSVDKISVMLSGYLRSTQPGMAIVNFMNYSNSTTYKTILSRGNQTDVVTQAQVNLWRSTSAITSIEFYVTGFNYASGSTFTLYGIKAA